MVRLTRFIDYLKINILNIYLTCTGQLEPKYNSQMGLYTKHRFLIYYPWYEVEKQFELNKYLRLDS